VKARFSFKGYYKQWYFRSLKELSFALLCEKNHQTWESAEVPELSVTYIDVYGKVRTHWADFLVDKKTIVEIKPRAHQKGKTVQAKAEAMKQFCQEKGYRYMMVSPRKVSVLELKKLLESGEVILDKNCEKYVDNYIKNRSKASQ